jgi:hypothetical protein
MNEEPTGIRPEFYSFPRGVENVRADRDGITYIGKPEDILYIIEESKKDAVKAFKRQLKAKIKFISTIDKIKELIK